MCLAIKKIGLTLCLAMTLSAAVMRPAHALDVPARPIGYVTDKAGLLSPSSRTRIEQALRQFEQQTTDQIVVVTFPSLEGQNLEDFSIRLAEAWQIGQKDRNNGVILLIFKKDRKIRLEVGYGLEGALTDAESGLIIQQVIAPYFKKNDFDQGIMAGVAAIMEAVKGEFHAGSSGARYGNQMTPEEIAAVKRQSWIMGLFILIAAAVLLVTDLFRYGQYAASHRNYRQRYSFGEWFFRFALLLAVASFIFRMLFYMMLFSRGGYGGGRGGGFSSGGGSFGGGGASGGW